MNRRIQWLDTARGYGILLVIIGHALTNTIRQSSDLAMLLYNVIYFFHMPLLFFISGYAFRLQEKKYIQLRTKEYLTKKVPKLIIPYISYSLIIYSIFIGAHQIHLISNKLNSIGYKAISIQSWIIDLLLGRNLYCQHLWYIYSLFLLSIISFFLLKIAGTNYKYYMLILSFIAFLFWINLSKTDLDIIWKTFYRGIWFALGQNLHIPNEQNNQKYYIKAIRLVPIFLAILLFVNYIDNNYIGHIIARYGELFLIFLIILFVIYISQIKINISHKPITWLGTNSFGIYLFHQPFFGSGIGVILKTIFHMPLILCILLSIILSIAGPLLIVRILDFKPLKPLKIILLP